MNSLLGEKVDQKRSIKCGIFTDTFPPNVGGVSTVTSNYAKELYLKGAIPLVAAPWYPDADDSYPYKVLRYPSLKIGKRIGYRAGNPFNPKLIFRILQEKLDIIHVHSPFISTVLARVVRRYTGVPIVLTYHSKFDIDIENRIIALPIRHASLQFMMHNIYACDAVWTVSAGAASHLRSLGYSGPLTIMRNGTDFKRSRSTEAELNHLNQRYGLLPDETVFLFVGRMMWYKNLKLIIDGLNVAKRRGAQFKMIFAGQGLDFEAVKAYTKSVDLMDSCLFVGLIQDRALLKISIPALPFLFFLPPMIQMGWWSAKRQLVAVRAY